MVERFGPWAAAWCDRVPEWIEGLARRWGLRLGPSATRGHTSVVTFCTTAAEEEAVLKVSPEPALGRAETAALGAWQSSRQVPRVLESDPETGALLLEAVPPFGAGEPALERVGHLARGLHAAAGEETLAEFPPLTERVEFIYAFWRGRLQGSGLPEQIPRGLFKGSLERAQELASGPGPRVLLHGDLHAGNVLDGGSERGLVAIDPRACVGDPAFDLVDWVLVPGVSRPDHRVEVLSREAGVDREALRRWCGCTAVLVAAVRLVQNGGPSADTCALLALAAEGSR